MRILFMTALMSASLLSHPALAEHGKHRAAKHQACPPCPVCEKAMHEEPVREETSAATPTSEIPYLNGGIGREEEERIKHESGRYNVKLLYTMPSGQYFSDIRMRIVDAQKNSVFELDEAGPIVLIKLPPGDYTLEASRGGVERTQKLRVGKSGMTGAHLVWEE